SGFARRLGVKGIVEGQFGRVRGSELIVFLGCVSFCGVKLSGRLLPEVRHLLPIGLGVGCVYVAAKNASNRRAFLRLDKELQVGLRGGVAADFGQQERIDVAAGGDEVEIASRSGLCRLDIAKVVRAIYDREFAVPGREIEDLLRVGQKDEGGEQQLGMNGNNVFLAALDDTRSRFGSARCADSRQEEREENQSWKKPVPIAVHKCHPPLKFSTY